MASWKFRLLLFVLAGASLSVWTVALAADYESPQSRSRKAASGWVKKDKTGVDRSADPPHDLSLYEGRTTWEFFQDHSQGRNILGQHRFHHEPVLRRSEHGDSS